MAVNVGNLMFEHPKHFQAPLERLERKQDEMLAGQSEQAGYVVSIVQHQAHLAGADATQQLSVVNINMRFDRIERCLELTH